MRRRDRHHRQPVRKAPCRLLESILLQPTELQPQQVISLLGLGSPSFPLSDQADCIDVGY